MTAGGPGARNRGGAPSRVPRGLGAATSLGAKQRVSRNSPEFGRSRGGAQPAPPPGQSYEVRMLCKSQPAARFSAWAAEGVHAPPRRGRGSDRPSGRETCVITVMALPSGTPLSPLLSLTLATARWWEGIVEETGTERLSTSSRTQSPSTAERRFRATSHSAVTRISFAQHVICLVL